MGMKVRLGKPMQWRRLRIPLQECLKLKIRHTQDSRMKKINLRMLYWRPLFDTIEALDGRQQWSFS